MSDDLETIRKICEDIHQSKYIANDGFGEVGIQLATIYAAAERLAAERDVLGEYVGKLEDQVLDAWDEFEGTATGKYREQRRNQLREEHGITPEMLEVTT